MLVGKRRNPNDSHGAWVSAGSQCSAKKERRLLGQATWMRSRINSASSRDKAKFTVEGNSSGGAGNRGCQLRAAIR